MVASEKERKRLNVMGLIGGNNIGSILGGGVYFDEEGSDRYKKMGGFLVLEEERNLHIFQISFQCDSHVSSKCTSFVNLGYFSLRFLDT